MSTSAKRLVLVVHGLGDSTPGETVRPLARAVAAATGRSRTPTEEVLWLTEGSGRQIDDFPCHVERLREENTETVLAEVYWADLSRLGHKMLDLLVGLFRAIFGLHQVAARHAADPGRHGSVREPAARALQWLSLASAYLLRGPAAAVHLLLAVVSTLGTAALITGVVQEGGAHSSAWVALLTGTAGVIGVAAGARGLRRRGGGPGKAFFLWLVLVGSMQLVFALTHLFYPLAERMQRTEGATMGKSWELGFWVAQWPQILATYLIVLAALAWLVARLRAAPAHRPGLDLAQAVNFAMLGLWVLLVQFLMLLISEKLPDKADLLEGEAITEAVASAAAFYWALALIPLGMGVATVGLRLRWAKRTRAASYMPSQPAPRLILGRGILASLIGLPVLIFVMSLLPELNEELSELLSGASAIVVPAAGLVAGVAIYSSERLRFALDFALDLVSHFEQQRSGGNGAVVYARRQRIRARLKIVLENLVRQEGPDHVTVLAHSQGTVVAAEALAEPKAAALLEPLARCDLVTMGSPFHHLYQHYFPHDYPPLGDERWAGLRERVDRWINIFRIDDPVGTDIEPEGEWPVNCPVDPGGHTGYWRDRQVIRILEEQQLV